MSPWSVKISSCNIARARLQVKTNAVKLQKLQNRALSFLYPVDMSLMPTQDH